MSLFTNFAFNRGKIRRPTDFIPNGCGSQATPLGRLLVPDELIGVDYSHCCDEHDLAYAQGGFWGLFTRKPKADWGMAACMAERFHDVAVARMARGQNGVGIATYLFGLTLVVPAYWLAVTALGWTPFTWRWNFVALTPEALDALKAKLSA